MMEEGTALRKLLAGLDGTVHYGLKLDDRVMELAPLIGSHFVLQATGVLSCIVCGRRVRKFYGQGFCFPCFRDAPEAAECIIRPERCRAHLGEGRDADWEREYHATEHVVYLSRTGGLKVGVTRASQLPVRWIDQGAVVAVVIARVPYRQLAGLIEVELKQLVSDRTDWRAMLRPVEPAPEALLALRDKVSDTLSAELRQYLVPAEETVQLSYPVLAYPAKVTSVQLAREPLVEGRLLGIKGQYLIWEGGRVLNVRNHSGYHVQVGA